MHQMDVFYISLPLFLDIYMSDGFFFFLMMKDKK